MVKIFRLSLDVRYDVVDFNDAGLKSFIDFAQRFCYNSADLVCGNYYSKDGRYLIEYLPTISENGVELNTSSRVAKNDGTIQVSRAKFDPMTIPMRFVILCHEYAHFYMNTNIDNETEADINGLSIYLSLGYPRIEASDAFTEAFMGADYAANGERYRIIHNYIKDFDANKIAVV